ncbi:hypothetical protein FRC10_003749 [Ceratobasidium sp. 414]|nr:hypothetical protein FRC10_003749 [Ceratobasidium sp. 414]
MDKTSLEIWKAKKELEILQRAMLNRPRQHARPIYNVMENEERKRKAALLQVRCDEINGRLRRLGWSDEDFDDVKDKLFWRAFINTPERLSEKGRFERE